MVACDTEPVCAEHTTLISSEQRDENGDCMTADGERRFVWYHKEEEQKKLEELRTAAEERRHAQLPEGAVPASSKIDSKDFKDKFRAGGGAKGKTGSTDFTRGKNAFVRPCTVGWKSQNQPLQRGGGNRTPRQKG